MREKEADAKPEPKSWAGLKANGTKKEKKKANHEGTKGTKKTEEKK